MDHFLSEPLLIFTLTLWQRNRLAPFLTCDIPNSIPCTTSHATRAPIGNPETVKTKKNFNEQSRYKQHVEQARAYINSLSFVNSADDK